MDHSQQCSTPSSASSHLATPSAAASPQRLMSSAPSLPSQHSKMRPSDFTPPVRPDQHHLSEGADSASKRQKRDDSAFSSPFATANPFQPLAALHQEDGNSASNCNPPASTQPKPPPIYVNNVVNVNTIITDFKQNAVGPYKLIALDSNKVKFSFESIEGYRAAVQYFEAHQAEYHTYQLKHERNFRVVIRGLHPSCDTALVMEELRALGYQPTQMTPVHHPVTKVQLPLFFVDLKPKPDNENIYTLTRLYYSVIKVEPPKPKRGVVQCLNCQEYGHSRNYCHKRSRCVKCSGYHSTKDCVKPKDAPPTCVNCNGQHTANYRGCSVHQRLQSNTLPPRHNSRSPVTGQYSSSATSPLPLQPQVSPSTFNLTNHSFPPLNLTSLPQLPVHVPPQASLHPSPAAYAATVQPQPLSQTQFQCIMGKLDSLLSLLQPILHALSQVLPVLLKQSGSSV